ncbi:MAG: dynamin family protein, partial [Casimicrobiaceae bacterium]
MTAPRALAARFEAYGEWRNRLVAGVSALHEWLREQDLADAQVDLEAGELVRRLRQDKLIVALVAEFSRGKSELINAIFFADIGARLLPATPGRTTRCPTELLFDASRMPSIQLLPIESRLRDTTVQELREYGDEWATFPLDLSDAGKTSALLARVSETKRVPVALARALGMQDEASEPANRLTRSGDKRVEVPCWRHAIINLPHPLLRQGLVILDTPGLNAAGTEPELKLNLLPSAEVVLFVLAADTGVTKTDLEVWRRDLAGDDPAQKAARIVVLNKIDSLWNGPMPEPQVAALIDRQVEMAAALLGMPPAQIFPVSAQKGLLAKIDGDDALLERSRLPALEDALASKLIPAKHDILGGATRSGVRALAVNVRERLEARQTSIAEQLADLRELRGKNQDVVAHMMARVTEEKDHFERGVQRFAALRAVFTQRTSELFDVIGLEALRTNAGRTRRGIERSPFTKGVRRAMTGFFISIRRDFDDAARRTVEIHDMMQAMYTQFASEQRTTPFTPPFFSMLKYQKEIDRLERA